MISAAISSALTTFRGVGVTVIDTSTARSERRHPFDVHRSYGDVELSMIVRDQHVRAGCG